MKKLLITGFDPFDGHASNPSWAAVQQLPEVVGNYKLCKLNIPTLYEAAANLVLDAAQALQPDVILCIGLAGGRDAVTPERIAVNIRDARIPDNSGKLCNGERIAADGPAAYFATVPVERMVQAIRNCSIPGAVSNTAGTYVCNDVLYTLLHHFSATSTRVGFIHVPNTPEQAAVSLPLDKTVQALIAAIEALDE